MTLRSGFTKNKGTVIKKLETLEIMSPVSPDDGSISLKLGSGLVFVDNVMLWPTRKNYLEQGIPGCDRDCDLLRHQPPADVCWS